MRNLLGRTLHEIAQGLESADGAEYRIVRVLGLLREIIPFEQCALLVTQAGREPQLVLEPGASPDERAELGEMLGRLLSRLVDERARPLTAPTRWQGAHLAVPIIGNDEAIGVLFVREAARHGAVSGYTEQHLRELAIVGAQLAGYLAMVEHARALDDARREAEAANRIKDEVLALVSRDLKAPLTSVLAWAHTLRFDETGPCARSLAVEAIERNVEAQGELHRRDSVSLQHRESREETHGARGNHRRAGQSTRGQPSARGQGHLVAARGRRQAHHGRPPFLRRGPPAARGDPGSAGQRRR